MFVGTGSRFTRCLILQSIFVANLVGCYLCSNPTALAGYENPAFDRGKARMSHGDWDGAVESFGESIGFSSESPDPYFLRGQCFWHMKNYDLAINDFDKALKIAPDKSEVYLWRGAAYAKVGQDDGAVKDYEQAIKLDPSLAKKYFAGLDHDGNLRTPDPGIRQQVVRGGRVLQQGQQTRDDHSIALYKQAMNKVYPNGFNGQDQAPAGDSSSSDRTVKDYVAPGSPASSAADQDRAGKKNQKRFAKNEEEREAKQDEIKHARAKRRVEEYSEAIRREPANAANYYHRGKAHQVLKNYDQAVADFSDAIRLSPQNSQFYLARASVYMLMNKTVLAEADVKSAHSVDPTLPRKVNLDLE